MMTFVFATLISQTNWFVCETSVVNTNLEILDRAASEHINGFPVICCQIMTRPDTSFQNILGGGCFSIFI